jgi:hypothetical protein
MGSFMLAFSCNADPFFGDKVVLHTLSKKRGTKIDGDRTRLITDNTNKNYCKKHVISRLNVLNVCSTVCFNNLGKLNLLTAV